MKKDILLELSYGMYAVGVKDGDKVSACIVNSLVQVTNQPNTIAISMNHSNYSHDCIRKCGIFTVSVLSEDTSGTVIGALGFHSGRKIEKLKNIRHKVLAEGVPVVKENVCCWFLCQVIGCIETPTHTVFLAEIMSGSEKSQGTPMTYEYYQRVIKGKTPPTSPVYLESAPELGENDESWICTVCSYVYDDPDFSFEDLSKSWICPSCGAPKSAFKRK